MKYSQKTEFLYHGFNAYLGFESNLGYNENTYKRWNCNLLTYYFSILTVTGALRDVISKKRQMNLAIMAIIYLQTLTS